MRALVVVPLAALLGCERRAPFEEAGPARRAVASDAVATGVPPRTDASAPRTRPSTGVLPGMIRIAGGPSVFGTPADAVPRVADEEPPAEVRPLATFDIDELPFPNERGAAPRTDVTRDEAAAACAAVGKRLCTASEWERACKGPSGATYPWVEPSYQSAPCGLGRPVARGRVSQLPLGERRACVTGEGVRELAGGPWEWTATPWNRGAHDDDLGVLKGGNGADGPLVGRCANGLGRPHRLRYPDAGFRCCRSPDGAPPAAEPDFIPAKGALGLARLDDAARADLLAEAPLREALEREAGAPVKVEGAWRWTPVLGDALVVAGVCTAARRCAIAVLRPGASAPLRYFQATGPNAPTAVRDLDPAVLWIHPHAGPTVAVRILHYREARVAEERPESIVRPPPATKKP